MRRGADTAHLCLVGGGHAHIEVLRRLGMQPEPGLRVTLVSRDVHTPYSGMLPGLIAGHYDLDEAHIDLRRLCVFAAARLIHGSAIGLDPDAGRVEIDGRPPLSCDLISIDTGSAPAQGIPGAAEHGILVKPIDRFHGRWTELRRALAARDEPARLVVVGGGAGGVELSLAIAHALRKGGEEHALTLISRSQRVPGGHNRGVQRRLRRELLRSGVEIIAGREVTRIDESSVTLDSGESVPCEAAFLVTSAAAPGWPEASGLDCDQRGFIKVDRHLRSTSHPRVFAAGDIAHLTHSPRPKAGVFAVRAGPVLADNLIATIRGERLSSFRPQRNFLSLIGTGDLRAVASRKHLSRSGSALWMLKEVIDRRFMRKYSDLPEMTMDRVAAEPAPAHASAETRERLERMAMACRGCGSKVGAPILRRALAGVEPREVDELVVGVRDADDAAVLDVGGGELVVQTVDWFRSPWDEPWMAGRIAAEHALGDLFAMGARPVSALAIITVAHAAEPLVEADLAQLMAGANQALAQAGAALAGGHTTEGDELAIGFSLTGLVPPGRVIRKSGMKPGQALISTKPLGTGVLLAGDMRGRAIGRDVAAALESMVLSSRAAAELLAPVASAMTDVTGFGLLGHVHELTEASAVSLRIALEDVPLLDGALELSEQGIESSLTADNLRIARAVSADARLRDDPRYRLLFDPQTCGGLLAAVPGERALELVSALRERGYPHAAVIGEVIAARPDPGDPRRIELVERSGSSRWSDA